MRADTRGPQRLSPAATSSSRRGPIVRRTRLDAVRARAARPDSALSPLPTDDGRTARWARRGLAPSRGTSDRPRQSRVRMRLPVAPPAPRVWRRSAGQGRARRRDQSEQPNPGRGEEKGAPRRATCASARSPPGHHLPGLLQTSCPRAQGPCPGSLRALRPGPQPSAPGARCPDSKPIFPLGTFDLQSSSDPVWNWALEPKSYFLLAVLRIYQLTQDPVCAPEYQGFPHLVSSA